jgi:hypothetical protein
MVPSSVLTLSINGECLTCGGLSLGVVVHLASFEFIADYFSGLSLSPRWSDSGTVFMVSTRSGSLSPWWSMTEDSPLPQGSAWGLCLLLPQPHHGKGTLRPSSL